MKTKVAERANELHLVLDEFLSVNSPRLELCIGVLWANLTKNIPVYIFGNGGSASQASHFSAEMLVRFNKVLRRALPVFCLNSDASVLTAISNDMQYNDIFARQIEGVGSRGVAFGLTTSGKSKNVLRALSLAGMAGMPTIVLTGEGGVDKEQLYPFEVTFELKVPSYKTPIIQEAHLVLLHIIADELEQHALEKR